MGIKDVVTIKDVQGVIFDMDGVILDSMIYWNRAPVLYLENIGIEPEIGLGEKMRLMTVDEGVKYLNERYGLNKTKDDMNHAIVDNMINYYGTIIEIKPGVRELLDDLKAKNIPITVASTSYHVMIEKAFNRLGILDYFCGIYTSEDVGCGKEKPDMFYKCTEKMGSKVENTWLIEDTLHSIKTANLAGFKTIGVYDKVSEDTQEEIKKVADVYLESLVGVRFIK